MPLSKAISSGEKEVILSDLDIPEVPTKLNPLVTLQDSMLRGKGKWVYKYTIQPFAFYYHTGTKQWKIVQVTSTLERLTNTIIGGWAGAPSYGGLSH